LPDRLSDPMIRTFIAFGSLGGRLPGSTTVICLMLSQTARVSTYPYRAPLTRITVVPIAAQPPSSMRRECRREPQSLRGPPARDERGPRRMSILRATQSGGRERVRRCPRPMLLALARINAANRDLEAMQGPTRRAGLCHCGDRHRVMVVN